MSRWIAAAGALVVSLDSMMNIAFPAIAASFEVPPERVRWVIICYVLTYAITAFAGGAVADRIGHVAVFRAGLASSVVAFVMGGAAPSFAFLLVARVVQGLAGGLIYGTAPALATRGAPASVRGRRLGFLSAAMGLGLLGSLPAGALVESFGWRAVYHVRVPAALAVLVWSAAMRSEAGQRERPPMAFTPALQAPVLRAGALSFVARGAIFAIWLLVPFYLIEARALGAFVGGVLFMLTPLGTTVAAPLGGRLADRVGPGLPGVVGLAIEAVGLAALGFVDGATPLVVVALALFVAGFGLGFFEVPNMATIMAAFPAGQQGAAGGLSFLARTLGVVAGVAVTGQIVAARTASVGFLGAFSESLLVAAVAVAIATVFALRGPHPRP